MRIRSVVTVLAAGLLAAACSSRGVVIASGPPDGPGTAATLGIPPGHLPPPGECRVWVPGRPPGHQKAPGSCAVQATRVPPHGWLVFNPGGDRPGKGHGKARGKGARKGGTGNVQVKVTVYGERSPEVIRYFERESGKLVREEEPGR